MWVQETFADPALAARRRHREAVLRRYKPSWFERPALPSVTPISDVLSDHHRPDRQPSRGGKRS